MTDAPQAFVISERPLIREMLAELLRSRCAVNVVGRFASLDDCLRRVAAADLVVCDVDAIAARTFESFVARASAKSPGLVVIRVDHADGCEDVVRRVASHVTPASASLETLTRHEIDVLLAVATGLRNLEVARRMGRSPKTVEKHRANLQRKLGYRSLAQLTAYAIHHGLLSTEAIIGVTQASGTSASTESRRR